eukprot:TRINITY_DN9578_c0_g3_i1.p1 TRINITY_DN9578_c0_g3~~TRINITY_DN9578_c0_g3_i1.p1  ORF type:complete len:714 (+),score=113.12 TRINITY_DN9578_c0_g3_i1:87-2228(+)
MTDAEKHFPLSPKRSLNRRASGFYKNELGFSVKGGRHVCHSLVRSLYKYVPIAEWLPQYPWREHSAKDLAGGATLGCILVAQSLAHADLCKVKLICGPYSCVLPPIIYSLFGTCVHSSVGTGGLVSLLTGEQMAKYGDLEERTHACAIFTLLVGVIITLMGVLRLAFLVRFLSRPALSGFITASALLIIVSQVKPMLGLPKSDTGGIFKIATTHPDELSQLNTSTVVLSTISFLFLANASYLKKRHWLIRWLGDFKELVALSVSAVFCSHYAKELNIAVVGDVPTGLPSLALPFQRASDYELAKDMIPGAFLVALVTFLSSFAGAKKFALKAGYQVVAINELLALGFANLGGALCSAVPTQIGLSRMGIAYSAGVKSQLGANVYVAGIVASVLIAFSTYLYYVPRCVLNAIIVNGASHLTEFEHMQWLWSLRSTRIRQRTYLVDFAVWWFACLSTLYLGAFNGILGTVGVSMLLIIYQVADPPIALLGFDQETGRWLSMKQHHNTQSRSGVLCFRLEGPLFYANVERLQDWLAEAEVAAAEAGTPVKAIIFSAAAMPLIDTTAIEALRQLLQAYSQRNIAFLFANVSGQPQRILQHEVRAGLLPAGSLESSWTCQDCMKWLLEVEEQREESPKDISSENAATGQGKKEPLAQPLLLALETPGSQGKRSRVHSYCSKSSNEDEIKKGLSNAELIPLQRMAAWGSRPDLSIVGES